MNCNVIQSRFAVAWKANFHHQDHLDFVIHWFMFMCLKSFILIVNAWQLILYDGLSALKQFFVLMEARAYNNLLLLLLLLYRKQYLHECQRKTLRLSFVNPRRGKSSSSQKFFKLSVLKNFANFTGKHLCWCLF